MQKLSFLVNSKVYLFNWSQFQYGSGNYLVGVDRLYNKAHILNYDQCTKVASNVVRSSTGIQYILEGDESNDTWLFELLEENYAEAN